METKTVTEKELSSYIKATKKALVCKNAKTKQMLADLVNDILCYCEENPNSTFEDIKNISANRIRLLKNSVLDLMTIT